MIVVDASVVVSALADDGDDGDRARMRLRGEELAAPHLIDVEVVSAWRRLAAAGGLDARRVGLAMTDLAAFRLNRVPHRQFVARGWELRSNFTIYDAMYVALAEALDVTLLTADKRLAASPGTRCAVEVLGH